MWTLQSCFDVCSRVLGLDGLDVAHSSGVAVKRCSGRWSFDPTARVWRTCDQTSLRIIGPLLETPQAGRPGSSQGIKKVLHSSVFDLRVQVHQIPFYASASLIFFTYFCRETLLRHLRTSGRVSKLLVDLCPRRSWT